ncbi:MAPEG family protein [Jannaschia pohangensis]|uniref:Uncharacterized conserved protein, MAPEG superfamily n=1 Tax=Jannaschia pohangensis TaxID=390807 RepID=A0A1I3Q4E0_9RHOB|nr:MAPEG family protein [Jannaschia pohangensis]SFJ28575.1 Uncharacterized conserved protein, MAPEG superfamily [Jannaschia pohangensis]
MLKWTLPALLVAGPAMAQDVPRPYDAYSHTFAALAGWALLMIVLLILSAAGKPRASTESGHPVRDYSDPYYRRSRAFMNAIETAGPFIAAAVAAVLVGAAPFWVNLFASVFLAARVAMAVVHIGTEIQPLRSAFWLIGTLCCIGLAVLALIGAIA